jgi:hypothetical protein
MKKIFTLVSFIFCLSSCIAQNKDNQENQDNYVVGFKGGLNYSTFNPSNGYEALLMYNLGVFITFPITSKFSFQPELICSREGVKDPNFRLFNAYLANLSNYQIVTTGSEIIHLDYIKIPFLAKYMITKGLFIEAGPQFNFNFYPKWTVNTTGDPIAQPLDSVNNITISAAFGLSLVSKNGVGGFVRYNLALTPYNQNYVTVGKSYDNVLQIGLIITVKEKD